MADVTILGSRPAVHVVKSNGVALFNNRPLVQVLASTAASVGENNTASNVGSGAGVYKQKVGVNLEFKTLLAGTNVSLVAGPNEITINSTAAPLSIVSGSGLTWNGTDRYHLGGTLTQLATITGAFGVFFGDPNGAGQVDSFNIHTTNGFELQQGTDFNFTIGGGSAVFTDSGATKAGIEYDATTATGAGFTANSLINKGFADGAYAPLVGGGYWALATGGTLTGNNTITMGSNTITFTGNRVTFTPNATNAGINVGSLAGNPSSLSDGDIWYNSTASALATSATGLLNYVLRTVAADSINPRIPFFATTGGRVTSSDNLRFDGTGLLVGGGTITANTRVDIRGIGTTTNYTQRWADSANTERMTLTDAGVFTIGDSAGAFRRVFNSNVYTVTKSASTGDSWQWSPYSSTAGSLTYQMNTLSSSGVYQAGFQVNGTLAGTGSGYQYMLLTTGLVNTAGQTGIISVGGFSTETLVNIHTVSNLAVLRVTTNHRSDTSNAFNPASGSGTFKGVLIDPIYNTSGTYSGSVYGIDYNPTNTSLTGATHYAARFTSGRIDMWNQTDGLRIWSGAGTGNVINITPTATNIGSQLYELRFSRTTSVSSGFYITNNFTTTATSGTAYMLRVAETVEPSSGTLTHKGVLVNPTYNSAGSAMSGIGFEFSPTITSYGSSTVPLQAFRSTQGVVSFTGNTQRQPHVIYNDGQGTTSTSDIDMGLIIGSTSVTNQMVWRAGDGAASNRVYITNSTTGAGRLTFYAGFTSSALMSFTGDQRIGVGIDTPSITASTRLDVRGFGTTSGTIGLRVADSANSLTFQVLDNSAATLGTNGVGAPSLTIAGTAGFVASQEWRYFSNNVGMLLQTPTGVITTGLDIGDTGAFNQDSNYNHIRIRRGFTSAVASSRIYTNIALSPTYNITAGTHTVYGIDYNPTLTSMTGVTHLAWRNTSGSVLIGHTALGATTTRLQVRGVGTTTGNLALFEDSAGTQRVQLLDNGALRIGNTTDGYVNITQASTRPAIDLYEASSLHTSIFVAAAGSFRIYAGGGTGTGNFIFRASNGLTLGGSTGSIYGSISTTGIVSTNQAGVSSTATQQNSPIFGLRSNFWDGAAQVSDVGWNIQNIASTTTNRLSTLHFYETVTTGSANSRLSLTSTGYLSLPVTPNNDDALTQVLVRDGTTGEIKYRTAASLGGGGGIGGSTGSVDNAILRADGTGGSTLQPSDIILSDTADLTLGVSGLAGASRTISTAGSATDVGLTFIPKGSGSILLQPTNAGTDTNGGLIYFLGSAGNGIGNGSSILGLAGASGGGSGAQGGSVSFTAGAGNVADGAPGTINLVGGASNVSGLTAGATNLSGGAATAGDADGGAITLNGGAPFGTGTGGSINLLGANAVSSGGSGGDITIQAGGGSGAGINGLITLQAGSGGSGGGGLIQLNSLATFSSSSTSRASLRVPHGTAPTSPVNGDIWTTTTSMYVRINGTTVDLAAGGGIGGSTGSVDNAILRADGTGGSTLQSSAVSIGDTGNIDIGTDAGIIRNIQAAGSGSNVGLQLLSKGTGVVAFSTTTTTLNVSGSSASLAFSNQSASTISGSNGTTSNPGYDLIVKGGNANTGDGTPRPGGHLYLTYGVKNTTGADGNIGFLTSSVSNWQSMERGMFILNALVAPTGNPSSGIFLWSDSGDGDRLTFRNTAGSIYDISKSVRVVNHSSTTLNEAATKGEKIILANATSNNITVNLPAAAGNTAMFHIKKIDSSTNTVTIDGNSTETIDGATTHVLTDQYQSVTIVSDGSNWFII